jgi:hypothetical protein
MSTTRNIILDDLQFLKAYINNIVIASCIFEEYITYLR